MNWPRQEVGEFAFKMEKKLLANDHKGGWDDCGINWLLERASEELQELKKAIESNKGVEAVNGEAADVANFCMMIADLWPHMREPQ